MRNSHLTGRMRGSSLPIAASLLLAGLALAMLWLALPAQAALAQGNWSAAGVQTKERGAVRSDGDGDVQKWQGLLAVAPGAGFLGEWVIQFTDATTGTITVDENTRLEHFGPPPAPLGIWIKAEGVVQPDNKLLADKVEVDEFEAGQVVVRFAAPMSSTDLAQFADDFHLRPRATLLRSGDIYLFETDDDEQLTVDMLLADGRVRWAELNYVSGIPRFPEGDPYRTWEWGGPDDSGYVNQGAYTQVGLDTVHDVYSGTGVVIAVLDTGVDLNHPALQGHLLPGRDLVADDNVAMDEGPGLGQGHGTHVAGIVTAVAPGSQILPVRVLDANGRGNTFLLAYGIEWAAEQGADVINLSLGADFDSTVLSETIAATAAAGVVLVASAGNDNRATPQYPAVHPAVISVTAVDGANRKAVFANYGAGWVDLAAPGVGIHSTFTSTAVSGASGYAIWSGTSMAAPFVSGAAALARQKFPAATPAQIADLLVDHGVTIDDVNPTYVGQLGRLLNIADALIDPQPAIRILLPLVTK